MHVTDYREFGWPYLQADDSADVAAMATVLALGLYESTDRFRFQDPSAPIPAPGIDGLVDEVRTHAAATAFAAANARTLYQDLSTRSVSGAAIGDPQSDGPLVDFDDPAVVNLAGALDAAAAQAAAATAQANRALRRLAQIAFGVVQHGTDDGDVAAIRRACAEVLEDGEHAAPAEFDDHTVVGRTRPPLSSTTTPWWAARGPRSWWRSPAPSPGTWPAPCRWRPGSPSSPRARPPGR